MADLPASQELVPSQEPDMPVMPAGRNTRGRAQTKKTRVGWGARWQGQVLVDGQRRCISCRWIIYFLPLDPTELALS